MNKRTEEEQKRLAIEGGKASGIARRRKRDRKIMIRSGWEVLNQITKDQQKSLLERCAEGSPAEQLTKNKLKMLDESGVEMLMIMEILTDPRTPAPTKAMTIIELFNQEFGSVKKDDGGGSKYATMMGGSGAFSPENIIIGIKHGIAKLSLPDLNKVSDLILSEIRLRSDENVISDEEDGDIVGVIGGEDDD